MHTKDNLERLLVLMETKMKVDKSLLEGENYELPLTGEKFQFTAVELGHLFCLVENEFKCHIDRMSIRNYEFNTISGIVDILNKICTQ